MATNRPTFSPFRYWLYLTRRGLRRAFSVYSTPHSIALGFALGMFISLTPTVGVQLITATAIALAIRANPVAATLPIWITNPATVPFVFWFNYYIGTVIIPETTPVGLEFFRTVTLTNFWDKVHDVLWPLLLGSFIVALISALITYPVALRIALRFQKRRERQEAKWRAVVSSSSLKDTYPNGTVGKPTSGRVKRAEAARKQV